MMEEGLAEVRDRASRALSMPVALRAGFMEVDGASSSWERSSPLVFLVAVLALAPLGVARAFFSSSASRASFSAFLRAASAFFASASSLQRRSVRAEGAVFREGKEVDRLRGRQTDFLAFDLAPLLHSWSSDAAFFAFSAAAFWLATSAFLGA